MTSQDLPDPVPLNRRVELRNWRFNKEHQLTGEVYNHPMLADGSFHVLGDICVVQEVNDYFCVKTRTSDFVFFLLKEHEAIGFDTIKDIRDHFQIKRHRMG